MKNKQFNQLVAYPSNLYLPYQEATGEMIPCIITDSTGAYVSSMDIPAIIFYSMPDVE